MFKSFIKRYSVDASLIDYFKGRLPDELLDVWAEYGMGSLLDGYLKLINPIEYQPVLNESYGMSNAAIPILVTAFGDIITWEENRYIVLIRYKYGTYEEVSAGFEFFWEDIEDSYFQNKFFELNKYKDAVSAHGKPAYDECFGYVPLLALGGSEKTENLKIVKTREHLEIMLQLAGTIIE